MARSSVELPDELRRKVEARAAEAGHLMVEEYVQALLRADAEFSTDANLGVFKLSQPRGRRSHATISRTTRPYTSVSRKSRPA